MDKSFIPSDADLTILEHIEKEPDGGYVLRIEGETCRLDVEDTPYVVTAVFSAEDDNGEITALVIRLNDGTTEPLDAAGLSIGKDNVPYCTVKQGAFPARLLRPAYYQLARHIRQDSDDLFYLEINSKRFYVSEKKDRLPQ